MKLSVFLSYNIQNDEEFVARVAYLLAKQPTLDPYFHPVERDGEQWDQKILSAIERCDWFVAVSGATVGDSQAGELQVAKKHNKKIVILTLTDFDVDRLTLSGNHEKIGPVVTAADAARAIAFHITRQQWVSVDGISLKYLFDYEKDIIGAYRQKLESPSGTLPIDLILSGCPPDWPHIQQYQVTSGYNPPELQDLIGDFRAENAGIVVDTRTAYRGSTASEDSRGKAKVEIPNFTFPEAGPRAKYHHPRADQVEIKVGVLVSGGIAPGINAVIDGIVKRHHLYRDRAEKPKDSKYKRRYRLEIRGYGAGFGALRRGNYRLITKADVERQAEMGGSLLATSRTEEWVRSDEVERSTLIQATVARLAQDGLDILYVIGGDGSMRAAHALARHATTAGYDLSVVAIPKTMDNDILWVWQAFGFLSAVEKAREIVLSLHTEAKSNPRLCILQLFGSDSGFVASHAGLASGVCDAVLIPEVDYELEVLFEEHIKPTLETRYAEGRPHGLIVMGETAIPIDASKYIAPQGGDLSVQLASEERDALFKFFRDGRRVVGGQTPDDLRTGGLKIVSGVLQKLIKRRMRPHEYWRTFRVFTSEPRHIIRSVPPSVSDVIFAERLGALAVDSAMAGYTDCMVSAWLTEFVLVPLDLVVLGRKRVPRRGIFWKSVLASTGQPDRMVSD